MFLIISVIVLFILVIIEVCAIGSLANMVNDMQKHLESQSKHVNYIITCLNLEELNKIPSDKITLN